MLLAFVGAAGLASCGDAPTSGSVAEHRLSPKSGGITNPVVEATSVSSVVTGGVQPPVVFSQSEQYRLVQRGLRPEASK